MSQIKDPAASCQSTSPKRLEQGLASPSVTFLHRSRGGGELKLLAAPGHLQLQQQVGTALRVPIWETSSSQEINWEAENLSGGWFNRFSHFSCAKTVCLNICLSLCACSCTATNSTSALSMFDLKLKSNRCLGLMLSELDLFPKSNMFQECVEITHPQHQNWQLRDFHKLSRV